MYSIICDYIGKPVLAYNSFSNQVWSVEYDIYGNIRSQHKGEKHFIPFRNQGQYEDEETGLFYNRFRYYDGSSGTYISQDPVRLVGRMPNLYSYVYNSNKYVDVFGLYFYYQLKDTSGNVIYHGITDQDIGERMKQHASGNSSQGIQPKTFDQVSYLEVDDRAAARNLEGSALYHEWDNGNQSLLNSRRNPSPNPGYYHSYNPDNIADGRKFLKQSEIDSQMQNATTKKSK